MKRIYSILLGLVLCLGLFLALPTAEAADDVTVNAANFPDANFRSYVSANCDTDGDGFLSDSEIAAVTSISVSNKSISSLRGVEFFTSLQELRCLGNQLTALDVSKNTELKYLACGDNQLTALDVSFNSKLEQLFCYNNRLTSLDVSTHTKLWLLDVNGNTSLTKLVCGRCSLKSLNLTGCAALQELYCHDNQLTQLSVSSCPALKYLDCEGNKLTSLITRANTALENLICSSNQLTALDVSNNTALLALYCDSNSLTALDLSSNTVLKYLRCARNNLATLDVSGNAALEELYCRYNQLTALDVSQNTALKQLDCYSNQLTSLDIRANTMLKTVYCTDNQLTTLDVSGCTALESLNCDVNQLTQLTLGELTTLKTLSCVTNQLQKLDVSGCSALDTLFCYDNALTNLGVSGCATLRGLYCYDNALTNLDISGCSALTTLRCYDNQLAELNISASSALCDIYLNGDRSAMETHWEYVIDNVGRLSVDKTTAVITESTAPTITTQPHDITAKIGDTALFKVVATGNDLTYQWQYYTGSKWTNSGLTGNKTAALKVAVTAARNGQQYRCVITDANGASVTSTAVKLYAKINITAQPKDIAAKVGDTAKFTVTATGAGLKYQWQYYTGSKWANSGMTGNKTAALSVPVTVARNGQKYRCVITDANGKTATSNAATLTAKPAITTQPADKSAKVGETVKFTVAAAGVNITYRWQYRTSSTGTWKNSGATGCSTATLSIEATAARNGYQYRCVVEDANGNKAISNAATLTIKPAITTQPKSATAAAGATVNFTVKATGAGLTYRWQYKAPDGTWKNSGATGYNTATLTVKPTAGMNGYQYRCVIVDANGTKLISSAATLTVK